MKYVAVDLETTGLDANWCQILEIGMIIDDTAKPTVPINELPFFHCLVRHDKYIGQPFALAMNRDIFYELAKKEGESPYIIYSTMSVADAIYTFLMKHKAFVDEDRPVFAGKNIGMFDYQFLSRLPNFDIRAKYTLDPGQMFFDPRIHTKMPKLQDCIDMTNMKEIVTHRGLDDAAAVIKLLRYKWSLLPPPVIEDVK